MATLQENIETIRDRGIYGTEIRAAIADAIMQSDNQIDDRVDAIRRDIETNSTYMETQLIPGTENDYMLVITNHL